MSLAIAGVFRLPAKAPWWAVVGGAVGLILHVVLSESLEIILWAGDGPSMLVAIAWLSPIVVGGVWLPRQGAWLTATGYWLVVFAAAVALGYNTTNWSSGQGYLSRWVF
jgi:hypothetical protein